MQHLDAVLFSLDAIIRECKPGDSKGGEHVCLYDRHGDKLLGRHPSKEQAYKQEYAIDKAKERRGHLEAALELLEES